MIRSVPLIALGFVIGGCRRVPSVEGQPRVGALRADSARFTVLLNGPVYEGEIGFRFTNSSGASLSMNYCKVPPPPTLEKQRADGSWVHAYSPIVLLCLTLPPFRIPNGGTYHGSLLIAAGRPGTNVFPVLEPDSIPGTYRLRWALRAGDDPNNRAAPLVDAVSPPFQLAVR
jgi:hypothetical protein